MRRWPVSRAAGPSRGGARGCWRRWPPSPILPRDNNADTVVASPAPGCHRRAVRRRYFSPRCSLPAGDFSSPWGTSRRRRRSCLWLPYPAAARIAPGLSTSQDAGLSSSRLRAGIFAAQAARARRDSCRTHRRRVRPRPRASRREHAADRSDGMYVFFPAGFFLATAASRRSPCVRAHEARRLRSIRARYRIRVSRGSRQECFCYMSFCIVLIRRS